MADDTKKPMGRPEIILTEETLKLVKNFAKIGLRVNDIVLLLKDIQPICKKTLTSKYGDIIREGRAHSKTAILNTLYHMATSGNNTSATIFAAKTICGIGENMIDDLNIEHDLKEIESIGTKDPLQASKRYIQIMQGEK
jgi:hypothetical protein